MRHHNRTAPVPPGQLGDGVEPDTMATSAWISSTASSSSKLNRTKSTPSKSRCSLRRMAHAGQTPSSLCVARNIRSQAAPAERRSLQCASATSGCAFWLCSMHESEAGARMYVRRAQFARRYNKNREGESSPALTTSSCDSGARRYRSGAQSRPRQYISPNPSHLTGRA